MRIQKLSATLLLGFLLGACVSQPTKIYETQKLNIKKLVQAGRKAVVIDENTVVVDARTPFNYSMAHIPGSQNIQWQDFGSSRNLHMGILRGDLFREARRLARKGIGPDSKVVVVGDGPGGNGEEGRVAWTLLYLGVQDVQFASIEQFRNKMSPRKSPPMESKKMWKPDLVNSILVRKNDLNKAIKDKTKKSFVLDVRTNKEYFNEPNHGFEALNIQWKEFFNDKGRPNWSIRKRLQEFGIGMDHRIFVVSNKGLRSGAVTAALLTLGFGKAANYTGGFKELRKIKTQSMR